MTSHFLDTLYTTIQGLQGTSVAGSVDVAYLGSVLRKAERHWEVHGFRRLSDALERLKERDVKVFRNDKGALQVQISFPEVTVTRRPSHVTAARFRPLRPPVWFAFTAALLSGQQRLLNRLTGEISGNASTPTGTDWVRVVPVDEDEQRGWAREFVGDAADKEALVSAIQRADWFRQFPASLDERRRRDWNRLRSERIIGHVKSWARENDIEDGVLFAASEIRAGLAGAAPDVLDLRRALLDALAEMPTEDLLALPIPARLVIKTVRPDLLQ